MKTLLRVALLTCFGASGVGAAVYLAATLKSPEVQAAPHRSAAPRRPVIDRQTGPLPPRHDLVSTAAFWAEPAARPRRIPAAPQPTAPSQGISPDTLLAVLDRFNQVAQRPASPEPDPLPAPNPESENDNPRQRPVDDKVPTDGAQAPAQLLLYPQNLYRSDKDPSDDGKDPPDDDGGPATSDGITEDELFGTEEISVGKPEHSIKHSPGSAEGDDHLDIQIKDEDLRDVLALLSAQGGLNILAGQSVKGAVSASLSRVSVEEALQAILKSTGYVAQREGSFIYVGSPDDLDMMKQLVDRIGVRVYRPNYVSSKDLSQLLTPMLTKGVGRISLSPPALSGISPNQNTTGGNDNAEAETVVVQDYERNLAEIDQVVKEIDKRPSQVAIEAMILSVALSDENKFGVDFQMLRNQQNVRLGSGSPSQTPLSGGIDPTTGAQAGAFNLAGGGMKFAFLDSTLSSFITALETIGDTNVIASPRVLCLNKQRAEIQIGEQLGYVTTTLTSTSTAQSINFLDTGAQLRLRPFIASDGAIRLEIHPELSTGSVTQQGNFTLPNKSVTQVTTNVMVHDGSTVVIGGLMREDLQNNITQIPLIGSLPVIGALFRNKDETVSRQEILVLITPRIVYDPEMALTGDQEGEEYLRRQAVYRDHMKPFSKRYMGRKALRKAQAAYEAGDRPMALKYVKRSIFYDATSRDAIEFRQFLQNGTGRGAGPGPVIDGHPLDGDEMAPWVLDQLEAAAHGPPRPQHPLDPGTPGKILRVAPSGGSADAARP